MTDLKFHLFNMSFEERFLQGKKQDHFVSKNMFYYEICEYLQPSKIWMAI